MLLYLPRSLPVVRRLQRLADGGARQLLDAELANEPGRDLPFTVIPAISCLVDSLRT
jgi:hypothetical protein